MRLRLGTHASSEAPLAHLAGLAAAAGWLAGQRRLGAAHPATAAALLLPLLALCPARLYALQGLLALLLVGLPLGLATWDGRVGEGPVLARPLLARPLPLLMPQAGLSALPLPLQKQRRLPSKSTQPSPVLLLFQVGLALLLRPPQLLLLWWRPWGVVF